VGIRVEDAGKDVALDEATFLARGLAQRYGPS
jgi:hypothetical protein